MIKFILSMFLVSGLFASEIIINNNQLNKYSNEFIKALNIKKINNVDPVIEFGSIKINTDSNIMENGDYFYSSIHSDDLKINQKDLFLPLEGYLSNRFNLRKGSKKVSITIIDPKITFNYFDTDKKRDDLNLVKNINYSFTLNLKIGNNDNLVPFKGLSGLEKEKDRYVGVLTTSDKFIPFSIEEGFGRIVEIAIYETINKNIEKLEKD